MTENKIGIHRIIQVDKELRGGTFPSAEKLAAEHECSTRTIKRDLKFLKDQYNAPVEFSRERNGYYYSDPNFMLKDVILSEGEMFTISTILPLMEQYKNTPLEDSFKSIMAKISEMLPDKMNIDSSFLNSDLVFINNALPKIDRDVFETIFNSIKTRETVNFKYKSSSSNEFKIKIFDPYNVICQKGNWYVIGFDHKRNEIRIFALSRMKGIYLINQKFNIPKDYDVKKYIDPSMGVWNNKEEPEEYELVFEKGMETYITEREWHLDQQVEVRDDGCTVLKFKSNQKQQIFSWIMSFASSVKVVKPIAMAEKIKEEAKKIFESYKC